MYIGWPFVLLHIWVVLGCVIRYYFTFLVLICRLSLNCLTSAISFLFMVNLPLFLTILNRILSVSAICHDEHAGKLVQQISRTHTPGWNWPDWLVGVTPHWRHNEHSQTHLRIRLSYTSSIQIRSSRLLKRDWNLSTVIVLVSYKITYKLNKITTQKKWIK